MDQVRACLEIYKRAELVNQKLNNNFTADLIHLKVETHNNISGEQIHTNNNIEKVSKKTLKNKHSIKIPLVGNKHLLMAKLENLN